MSQIIINCRLYKYYCRIKQTHMSRRIFTGFLILAGILTLLLYSCTQNEASNTSGPEKKTDEGSLNSGKETWSNSATLYKKGEEIYKQNCQACHQANGEGLPNAFPPLAKSDYLLSDKQRAIKQVINGSNGEITVNNKKFNGVMPPQMLSDAEISEVLNYVLHTWGNSGETVTADEVKSLRGK